MVVVNVRKMTEEDGVPMPDRILVTGGAGFIGSRLCFGARKAFPGATVTALDNLHRRGSELQVPRLARAGIEFVHGDVRNLEDLKAAGACDVVIDAAAEPSVLAGIDGDPGYVVRNNLAGAINTLEHARRCGAGLVFLSSSRVYPIEKLRAFELERRGQRFSLVDPNELRGVTDEGINERFPLDGPRSLYGASKLAAELLISEYAATFGVPAVINRCGVVAGPWQMARVDQGVVGLWCARHVFGGRLDYIGWGGYQVRDALHVDDLVDLVMYQVEELPALKGRVFNVGGGIDVSFSLRELTVLCREVTGASIEVGIIDELRPGDVPYYVTDSSLVRDTCDWLPARSLRRIVEDTVRWLSEHQDTLRPLMQ